MRPCKTKIWPSLSVWTLSRSTHCYLRSSPRVIICQTVGQTRVISAGSDKDILGVLGDNSAGSKLFTQAQKASRDQVSVYFPSLFPQYSSFRVCRKMSSAEFLMIHVFNEIAQFQLELLSFSRLPGSNSSYSFLGYHHLKTVSGFLFPHLHVPLCWLWVVTIHTVIHHQLPHGPVSTLALWPNP